MAPEHFRGNEEIEKTLINDFKFNTNNVEAKIVKSLADNKENFIEIFRVSIRLFFRKVRVSF